jgi:glycosyltransferase involved in cell wall biosynthesis
MIVLSDDWVGLPTSCKHLLGHFLTDIPITWVDTIGFRSPGWNLYDFRRALDKMAGWVLKSGAKPCTETRKQNPFIIDPLQMPFNHYGFVRRMNALGLVRSIQRLHRPLPGFQTVLLTTWPFLGDIIGRLNEQISIYYRMDDFSEFPGVRKGWLHKAEASLMTKVDLVVATADRLAGADPRPRKVKLLPHGVDYEHFSSCPGRAPGLERLLRLPAPRVGFFGLLNAWVDLEMVRVAARARRDWSFVIIGPTQLPSGAHPSEPNMHYFGPVAYEHLPAYAHHFDVGMIPFKVNDLTLSVNPLKLMEYFAAGLPVVSTPIPEVLKYKDVVHVAEGPGGLCGAIGEALETENELAREKRRGIARLNGWKAKSRLLREWIEEELSSVSHGSR